MSDWVWPNGEKTEPRVNSPWNPERMHPVFHRLMPHYGTDFHMPEGINRSITDGTVVHVGIVRYWEGLGYGVWVRNTDGSLAKYGHGKTGSAFVKLGERVTARQPLSRTGMTGTASGVHLHLEISPRGGAGGQVDPEPYIRSRLAETAGDSDKPFTPDAPAEQEEDDMAKNVGIATQRESDGVWFYLIHSLGEGRGVMFNSGSEKPVGGAAIDALAVAYDTPPWAKVSESLFGAVKRSLAEVDQIEVMVKDSDISALA